MDKIIEDLENLKKEIDAAKTERAQLEGRLNELIDRLRNEFNCRSLEDAEKKTTEMEGKLKKLEGKIEKEYAELKENFEW